MARFKIRSQKSDINFNSAFNSQFPVPIPYSSHLPRAAWSHGLCYSPSQCWILHVFSFTVTASAINMFIVHCKGQSPTMPFLHWSIMSYEISSKETNSSWNIVISHGLCCQFVNVHYFSLYLLHNIDFPSIILTYKLNQHHLTLTSLPAFLHIKKPTSSSH